ncbi:plasmid mobilization relaxosome protein MobC (plasmid) [Oscillospiraceae bacterium PP1C4]
MPRKRQNQMIFCVDDNEKSLILERINFMKLSQSDYLRQMALNGVVVNVDYTEVKRMTQEINRVGVNINQIAKRINETNEVYAADVEALKESLEKIWQLQRYILSSQR